MSIIVASFMALYIRFEFSFSAMPREFLEKWEQILPINILLTLLFFVVWKLYKSVWRYASLPELVRILWASLIGGAAQIIGTLVFL